MNACTRVAAALFAAAALAAVGPARAAKPHEHGAVTMDVAVEGGNVNINVELPLDSLVGFERAPRNDAERKAAADALARLRDGAKLFRLDAAAQCTLGSAKVEAPVLEQGAPAKDGHADADASYVFSCAQPASLTTLEVLLFDAFRRIERVQVQAALPRGQRKVVLRRTARTLKLAP
jgi:hypothetical protein